MNEQSFAARFSKISLMFNYIVLIKVYFMNPGLKRLSVQLTSTCNVQCALLQSILISQDN